MFGLGLVIGIILGVAIGLAFAFYLGMRVAHMNVPKPIASQVLAKMTEELVNKT